MNNTFYTGINDDARHNHLRGKTFYTLCPDNEKYYRTIYIHYNIFQNSLRPFISNPIYGTPPTDMEPIAPILLSKLMKIPTFTPPF
jgi:hypothetical protein